MRRKSDMWEDFGAESFLPGEGEQARTAAVADVRERLAMVEEQLKSQFTSMAAYAQISQQAIDTARAESRADLEREKATLISLIERLRDEVHSGAAPVAVALTDTAPVPVVDPDATPSTGMTRPAVPTEAAATVPTEAVAAAPAVTDPEVHERLDRLERRFEELSEHFAQTLKYQEDLANSIAFMFERQLQESGWLASCDAGV